MAFQPAPDVCKVMLSGVVGETAWSVGLHFAQVGFDSADMQALLDHLEDNFVPDYMEQLSRNANASKLVAYDMRTADGDRLVNTFDVDGSDLDTPTAISAAGVISFYASGRGKWNQGRNYVCGFAEDDCDEHRVQQGTIEAVADAYRSLITSPAPGWTWVVVSRYLNKAKRAQAIYAPVIRVEVRNLVFGSQRRRLRKT